MKATYEKPSILKLQSGMMQKFGSSPLYARNIRKEIDGVAIEELTKEYGSPLFVYSERKIRETHRTIEEAFSTRYPNVTMGWSYKTNFNKAICAVMHDEGSIAEVVSGFEYEKAVALGIDPTNIIFNGPHKPMDILERAARDGAMINIDHMDELYDMEKVADKLGKKLKVGMRVNMDTGIHPQWTRFGLNLESGQAMDAVKRMASVGKLELAGLHCHIGTYILDPEAYAIEVEKMVKFAYEIEDAFGFKVEYFDIGGGFPSRSKLKGTYLPADVAVPPVEAYAEKVTDALYHNLRPGDFPKLYLETGRGVIDEAGYLISTIFAAKRLPDGRRSYIADAGVNLLFTSFWYKFNIELDREVRGLNEPSVIYGPLCMNIDVIDEGTMLPPLPRGTRMIVSPVGAYNTTQWMQFIEYRPAVVMIGMDGQVDLIRRSEKLEDVEGPEILPERLKLK